MDKKILIAGVIIIIALLAWAPWLSATDAQSAAKTYFEKKNVGIMDGCGFNCNGCGVKEAHKMLFGYSVDIEYACGLLPADKPEYHQTGTINVYSFGITKEVSKPAGYQPPTKGPETVPVLVISNFNFSETSTGPANFTISKIVCGQGGTACASRIGVTGTILFSGPIQKPTPCNGLNATYIISGNTATVDIEATPYKGGCIEVIADTFYEGSFDYAGTLDTVIVNYNGQELGRI